ncbi:MAG: site-2 protease family protein [Oscillospiraceae bacterium]|nr:site-2 protease family protein [Oscillospiraceae bacterium]MDD4546552.1 site-2 protease family protein [Oscillospiraceae bacterium]
MIMYLIQNRFNIDFINLIFIFISYALIILVALPVHELAHAFTADRMGDSTARWNGRLTMNPFAHLDLIGTIMIFVFGFGYAKPVPVNPRNFKNYKAGMFLTSFAGPASNLVMAFLSLLILRIVLLLNPVAIVIIIMTIFLRQFALINITLAVFNLLPIPPLDGFRIISNFLSSKIVYYIEQYQWYITMGLFLLIATRGLSGFLSVITFYIYNFFSIILNF